MCAITLDAHNRDVQERLVLEKVNSKDAFQWQSMLKCYWKEDVDDASMEIADAKLPYGYATRSLSCVFYLLSFS